MNSTLKRLARRASLFIVVGVFASLSLVYNEYNIKKEIASETDLSEIWVNDVLGKDYDGANSIKQNGNYKINTSKYNNPFSGLVYKCLLDNIVDKTSIVGVSKLPNGKYDYELSVPVWGTIDAELDSLKPRLKDITSKYAQKLLSEDEFNKQLSIILNDGLNSSLKDGDKVIVHLTLETKSVGGVATLYYTSDFMSALFSTSKTVDRLEWYKSQIDFYLTN